MSEKFVWVDKGSVTTPEGFLAAGSSVSAGGDPSSSLGMTTLTFWIIPLRYYFLLLGAASGAACCGAAAFPMDSRISVSAMVFFIW